MSSGVGDSAAWLVDIGVTGSIPHEGDLMDSAKLCALAAAAALVFGCSSSSRERVQGGAPLFESNVSKRTRCSGGPDPYRPARLNTAGSGSAIGRALSDVTGTHRAARTFHRCPKAAAAEPKPAGRDDERGRGQVRQRFCDDLAHAGRAWRRRGDHDDGAARACGCIPRRVPIGAQAGARRHDRPEPRLPPRRMTTPRCRQRSCAALPAGRVRRPTCG
jgi:hypothetical protein